MAWTDPRDWTALADPRIVTAAMLNTDVRDNLNAIANWSTRTFDSAHYAGIDSMTWTVTSGDVTTFKYKRYGHTMIVNFDIGSTTVGGTLDTDLLIAIPESCVSTHQVIVPCLIADNTTVPVLGKCFVQVSGTVIHITKPDNTINWSASTNNTFVQGQIVFEIN